MRKRNHKERRRRRRRRSTEEPRNRTRLRIRFRNISCYNKKKKEAEEVMDELPGSAGTIASFSLRLGQAMFSSASLLFMSFGDEFYGFTAFCCLVTIMGLVIPWSFTLAMVDGYSVLLKCPIQHPGILLIIFVGDWVHRSSRTFKELFILSILTLAAACSTASVADVLVHSHGSHFPPKYCSRYQISAVMALLSWLLSFTSSLFNLWLIPNL